MSRIGYLRIPLFQTVVHQRHKGLQGKPFALITGKLTPGGYTRARIFMCSKEANKKGVAPGQRLTEAKALCSDLILRECDDVLYTNVQKQLTQDLISCSPKVASQHPGEFSLDASGLLHIGGEIKFCHGVLKVCAKAGFPDAHIGIADTTFAAMVASRLKNKKMFAIPRGQDAQFLAPLSIVHLGVEPEVEETLINLGVKSLGQLAQLPVDSLIERFGEAGKLAHDLVRGWDLRYPTIPEAPKRFECSIDMGGAISSLNETIFALKSILDRLTAELKRDGLWAEELIVSFFNEDDLLSERSLKFIRSSNQAKFLLEVIRLSLEAEPLLREFTKITLCISRFSSELWEQNQIDDLAISTVSSERKLSPPLILLLQRFLTRLGEHKAVKPVPSDHYDFEDAGVWVPLVKESYSDAVIPIDNDYLLAGRASTISMLEASGPVLRKCTGITQVIVELKDAVPSAINYQTKWYRVRHITTPEYLSSNWWDNAATKTYYKVLVEPASRGAVCSAQMRAGTPALPVENSESEHFDTNYRRGAPPVRLPFLFMLLVHDQTRNAWFIEGLYD
jgi:nucleotidyltransferase/DNA polymerase involved in DNA repair